MAPPSDALPVAPLIRPPADAGPASRPDPAALQPNIGAMLHDVARLIRRRFERRARQMDAAYAALGRTSGDYWSRRMTNRVSMLHRHAGEDDPLLETLSGYLTPRDTVIAVGAGPGRYTVPLASRAGSVVAVEPDAAMVPLLAASIQEAAADNGEIVAETWQDAEVPPATVVLCAHVLYPLAGVVPFIVKLDQHATGACFIALRDTVPEPEPLGRLWERFHGEPRYLQPGYAEAFDVLYEMGIRANVRVWRAPGQSWAYESMDQAVAAVREHLILPEDSESSAEIRHELEGVIRAGEGGVVTVDHSQDKHVVLEGPGRQVSLAHPEGLLHVPEVVVAADDLGREPVPSIAGASGAGACHHTVRLRDPACPGKLTLCQVDGAGLRAKHGRKVGFWTQLAELSGT